MHKLHHYEITVDWTGNEGEGTAHYKRYNRNHTVIGKNKDMLIPGSSDPSFLGDEKRYNPEELFLSSIATCHMLWYLHLCASNGVIVLEYNDKAEGTMEEKEDGSGQFTSVVLKPTVVVSDNDMIEVAKALHHDANQMCFIANSCNFPIDHDPLVRTQKHPTASQR